LFYFAAGDVLWRTDGTVANTIPLTVVGAVITQPNGVGVDGNLIFAGQENDGYHLWRSDGTAAGTVQYTGVVDSAYPFGTEIMLDDIFFYRKSSNREIFFTDGHYNQSLGYSLGASAKMLGQSALLPYANSYSVLRADHDLLTAYDVGGPNPSANVFMGALGPVYYFAVSQLTTGLEAYAQDLTDTTAAICSAPNAQVPDNNTTGFSDTIYIPEHTTIKNLTVDLKVSHSYVGDLSVTLERTEQRKTITLLAQASDCPSEDLDIVLDDAANIGFDANSCNSDSDGKAFPPNTHLRPSDPLTQFVGQDLHGHWALRVIDHSALDVGGVTSWCLDTSGKSDFIFRDGFQ
jgi:subtilisin-like proprotein convertase family protein